MPVDEFGREIPAAFGRQPEDAPTPRKVSETDQQPPPYRDSRAHQYPAFAYVNNPLKCEILFQEETSDKSYEEYRKSYCLSYVRTFFNIHLDDSWFRRRYSSFLRYQDILKERERAAREATALRDDTSLDDLRLTGAKNSQNQASGHLFSFQRDLSKTAVVVSDMPTHLTDEQLLFAIEATTASKDTKDILLYHTNDKTPYLTRSVLLVGSRMLLESLRNELNFECSTDPYNRTGVDADGHGGATADGRRVPTRTVKVKINPVPSIHPTVLSATLSTPTRFESDLEKATKLAERLDERNNIPVDCNLQSLLNHAEHSVEQRLDMAVAYLRRVHLRTFYHQPDICHTFAQMVTAPLYVRMNIVEDIDLEEDLLVKHLDDGLTRALEGADEAIVDESELRQEAESIERDVQETEQQWVRDHSISHQKGRARCSFHFCNKLFQDDTFLQKHLRKKHLEYLVAEQAKCHDKSMMKAWDEAKTRPVPEILVDCGAKFGWVSARLLEGGEPDVEDPEPRLFKEDEERQASMQRRREDTRQQHQYPQHKIRRTFEDVDYMPEEKVELTFDSAVATIVPKKKKKKRKLL